MAKNKTKFKHKCDILADLWLNYKEDSELADFIKYNDLGLPLAYAINEGIVEKTALAKNFVDETFELLLSSLGLDDAGYHLLDELL